MVYKVYITKENGTFYITHKGITKELLPTDVDNEYYAEFKLETNPHTLCCFYKPTGKSTSQIINGFNGYIYNERTHFIQQF